MPAGKFPTVVPYNDCCNNLGQLLSFAECFIAKNILID